MKTTIDQAGRVVIPKPIRDALGLAAGTEIDIEIDGVGIRIDGPELPEPELVEQDGFVFIKVTGTKLDDDIVHRLREERLDDLESR